MRMGNVLFRLSDTPGAIRWTGRSELGADTDAVLTEAGIDPDRVTKLRDRGVLR
jgi:crotonobetainyl-CoA:carnitine CoA-transferase CaiB-like acyl-CoA transferase